MQCIYIPHRMPKTSTENCLRISPHKHTALRHTYKMRPPSMAHTHVLFALLHTCSHAHNYRCIRKPIFLPTHLNTSSKHTRNTKTNRERVSATRRTRPRLRRHCATTWKLVASVARVLAIRATLFFSSWVVKTDGRDRTRKIFPTQYIGIVSDGLLLFKLSWHIMCFS